jgi:hypothetical protein
MVMVPLYGISSFIALYSLEAAFVIDVIRDIYEVRCFFVALVLTGTLINSWQRHSLYIVSSASCFLI